MTARHIVVAIVLSGLVAAGVAWLVTDAEPPMGHGEVPFERQMRASVESGPQADSRPVERISANAASIPEPRPTADRAHFDKAAFEQHLIDYITAHFTGKPPTLTGDSLTTMTAAGDKGINPEGKKPSESHLLEIAAIIRRFEEKARPLHTQERMLCGVALAQAVAMGQYLASDPQQPMDVSNLEGFTKAKAQIDRQQQSQKDAYESLSLRLGKPMKDWSHSVLSTMAPNGNGYLTTVYYTASQAPELFEVRNEIAKNLRERRQELKRFFAAMPK